MYSVVLGRVYAITYISLSGSDSSVIYICNDVSRQYTMSGSISFANALAFAN